MKLTYFPVRGRVEPILLLLVDSGVDFEHEIISIEEWTKLKNAGLAGPPRFPFGAVPTLTFGHGARGGNDTIIAETGAILLYLEAKLAAPGAVVSPPDSRARLEMIRESSAFLLSALFSLQRNNPSWLSPPNRQHMHDTLILPYLKSLSHHLSSDFFPPLLLPAQGPESVPRGTTTLSPAAASACITLDMISDLFPHEYGSGPNGMQAQFPRCQKIKDDVFNRPRVQAWLEKKEGGREKESWTRTEWGTRAFMQKMADEARRVADEGIGGEGALEDKAMPNDAATMTGI